MHMVMCILVLQMVLHVQCIHKHGMIQETKKDAHNAIKTSTPDQVTDLPKPPNHIIVDIKPIQQTDTAWKVPNLFESGT
jgi:hypothetical protein